MKPRFEVETAGLRSLMSGKPKNFIVRELIQNALDEPITTCVSKLCTMVELQPSRLQMMLLTAFAT